MNNKFLLRFYNQLLVRKTHSFDEVFHQFSLLNKYTFKLNLIK